MVGAVSDPAPIGRKERPAIIAERVGEPPDPASVGIHGVDFQVAIAGGCENDLLAARREGGFCVVTGTGREPLGDLAAVGGVVNLVLGIDAPHVPMGVVGARRALLARFMGGGVEHVLAVGVEVPAGGAAGAGRGQVLIGAVAVHDENLVALVGLACGHEDQAAAVIAEVSFGIQPAEGQLLYVAKMLFPGVAQRVIGSAANDGTGSAQAGGGSLLLRRGEVGQGQGSQQ